MDGKDGVRPAQIGTLALAAGCVPAIKTALMYWEYRLQRPVSPDMDSLILLLGLVAAGLITSILPGAWPVKLLRIALIGLWSYVALLIVAFVPGCLWAPACL